MFLAVNSITHSLVLGVFICLFSIPLITKNFFKGQPFDFAVFL
jgi:hypothetical protein